MASVTGMEISTWGTSFLVSFLETTLGLLLSKGSWGEWAAVLDRMLTGDLDVSNRFLYDPIFF